HRPKMHRDDPPDLSEPRGGSRECLPSHGVRKAAPRREEEVEKEQHHHDPDELHDVDVQRSGSKPAEAQEQHRIAAREQDDDARPNPWKEAAEDALPKLEPEGWLKGSGRGTQHHISEEHTANQEKGSQDV